MIYFFKFQMLKYCDASYNCMAQKLINLLLESYHGTNHFFFFFIICCNYRKGNWRINPFTLLGT